MKSMTIPPEIETLINEIRDDRTHGASQLARQALELMKAAAAQSRAVDAAEFRQEFGEIATRLKNVRPSMVPIFNSVVRLESNLKAAHAESVDSLRQQVIASVSELVQSALSALTKLAACSANLLSQEDVVLTHSYSSTVAGALKEAHKAVGIRVIVTRSGVGRTGERIAWELNLAGVPVTFIDDCAVGFYIKTAQKVLVGADRVCADGGLVNGIGTSLVAQAAKNAGVPFYVLCDTLKFDCRLKSTEVILEEKEPAEVVPAGVLPADITVKNPYFDITPPELITGIVTEIGLIERGSLKFD
jgi:ribose 1,5-bisphosphate isomerase